ncbi:PEP-CTERM sorting domain-containing protein [Azohydromonas caseinilytica]|uniref:PEP-CTERM sorting domain-containing protein n=1 Tax=Azohydromonas caseinilytica TaxID=2728836 RepID=A0A848F798_9BURK|nr:PEP-CTERM sorting domain-containing protein [Azohydromonas caseinilytica]NML15987.1 PEP-CTERM sorting domain-containing protein [Azohydromonas caseinilytica]
MRMFLIAAASAALLCPGLTQADIAWRDDAAGVLKLQERITRTGNGLYAYHYTFSNLSEQLPIWWLVLYTDATALSSARPLRDADHPGWQAAVVPNNPGLDVYLQGYRSVVWTYSASDPWPGQTPRGVYAGQTVAGFSFESAFLDRSVKHFVADRQGEWADPRTPSGHQSFSYGGFTVPVVPEPASVPMWLLGLGALGWAARRRH